jgi:hypothetical protein
MVVAWSRYRIGLWGAHVLWAKLEKPRLLVSRHGEPWKLATSLRILY